MGTSTGERDEKVMRASYRTLYKSNRSISVWAKEVWSISLGMHHSFLSLIGCEWDLPVAQEGLIAPQSEKFLRAKSYGKVCATAKLLLLVREASWHKNLKRLSWRSAHWAI